ncbi:MAG: ribosome small subunit-dependent GTPase A [Trueperella sp.]|uniref:ribosome small subunit-dependent GTPase A n=1 Tax=Trueperella sp. TaxID=2699835 RepID=UPI0025DBC54C|nr:ribosome small subunit-dependent GTPase A [Trueperella sp.]MCI7306089.1 ribosome small subunit-dependent GTPase A [Trueperella sp.]
MSENLARVGWSPAWQAHVAVESALTGVQLTLARVVNVHKSHVDVVGVSDGDVRANQRLAIDGALISAYGEEYPPAVGDWLMLDDERVHALVPRRTLITRPSAGRDSRDQVIAANVDIALVIEPFVPTFSLGRVERLAALAESAGVEPWIVCTKTDLVDDEEISRFRGPLEAKFPHVRFVSALDEETVADLAAEIPQGATMCVLVRSGAGKTTLINLLTGASSAVGAVREVDAKGRHTTTHRQVFATDQFIIIDNPGVRAVGAVGDVGAVESVFPGISQLRCRFANCTHTGEPGCAVRQAMEDGTLDPNEVERFIRMKAEAVRNIARKNARVARQEDRQKTRENQSGRRAMMRNKGR